MERTTHGKLFVVGIGPGGKLDRTLRAEQAIASSQVIAGYKRYIKSVQDLTENKEIIATGMTKEIERCRLAIEAALEGKTVSLISSGDPGIYAMAGLALEMIHSHHYQLDVEIIPGVTAASATAALLGAPLMLDFAVISLSDLLVDWPFILRRVEAVASADLVVALYNPRSKKRIKQLEETVEVLLKYRPPTTPVGIGTSVGYDEEQIMITSLGELLSHEIGMSSLVIVGNTETQLMDKWLVNPRGYKI